MIVLALSIGAVTIAFGQGCGQAASKPYASNESSQGLGPCPKVDVESPKNTEDLVALINSLPKPTSIECVLASLKRPLAVFAANSNFSAQPAVGSRSPRIFIFSDKLILSVAPDGVGRDLLEMSVLVNDSESIKGEIAFPVQTIQDIAAPFTSIRFRNGTNCAICHASERRANEIGYTDAFISRALRPDPFLEVNLENVRLENKHCDFSKEPERCAILRGVFGYGQVTKQEFPQTMPTAF